MNTVLEDDTEPKEPLSPTQEAAFLSFVQHDKVYQKYYDEIIILLGTGLRISELCGLTEADIDLDKQLINVDHQLLKIADVGYYVETPKTKSGNRVIPMSEKVLEAFQRVLNKRKYAQPVILEGYTKFLFLNRNGLPKVAVNLTRFITLILPPCSSKKWIIVFSIPVNVNSSPNLIESYNEKKIKIHQILTKSNKVLIYLF